MTALLARRRFLLLVGTTLVGCGGASTESISPLSPAEVEPSSSTPPPPRDTHEQAATIVGAKLWALLHVDRVKDHPLAPKLVHMKAWSGIFEATGIDPLTDVDRAFVAAASARDQEAVIAVAEHHLTEDRVKAAMDQLVAEGGPDGRHLPDLGVPAVRVDLRGRKSVLLAVSPTLLVVTSDSFAKAAAGLATSGGLPEPDGPEAVVAAAEQPSETLKVRGGPRIPKTIQQAEATVTFAPDGGADVLVVGRSTGEQQAKKDAEALTKAIDRATTVKVSIVKIRAFDPVRFEAKGTEVTAKRHVTTSELSTLIGFAEMMAR